MTEYRRMTTGDVDTVTDLAVKALAPSAVFGLSIDRAKVRAMVWGFANAPDHFHLIAFDSGRAVGAVALYVLPSWFFEGSEAHVVMTYADRPGPGKHLIDAMMAFIAGNDAIKRAIWPMNDPSDPRAAAMGRMVKRRYGFTAVHDNLVMNKGS